MFEIGKCFRNEGMDREHLQEFTMIESYEPCCNYEQLKQFSVDIFNHTISEMKKIFDLSVCGGGGVY